MKVITENTVGSLSRSSVVTVGNFDGVHLGHKALINRCISLSQMEDDVSVVTFEPLPQTYFSPTRALARLNGPGQKLGLLEQSGVDLVWMMRFNQELAEMSAESFAKTVFADTLAARTVVVGNDFRFGKEREGDLVMLKKLGSDLGFTVSAVADVEIDRIRVSSTVVREMLANGLFDLAQKFLGYRFVMRGEVIQGSHLGRTLGYPTANLKLEAEPSPLSGVFAVKTRVGEGKWLDAIASLGTRPVVAGDEFLVEVHIFDFSGDLYGSRLEVDFISKIRDEENFDSMEQLVAQMKKDESTAREILRQQNNDEK